MSRTGTRLPGALVARPRNARCLISAHAKAQALSRPLVPRQWVVERHPKRPGRFIEQHYRTGTIRRSLASWRGGGGHGADQPHHTCSAGRRDFLHSGAGGRGFRMNARPSVVFPHRSRWQVRQGSHRFDSSAINSPAVAQDRDRGSRCPAEAALGRIGQPQCTSEDSDI